MAGELKGYLVLNVEEASGKTQKEALTWDTSPAAGLPFEAFVKVELRGGPRNIKVQTRKAGLNDDTVTWGEQLVLEVLDNANELRLMLCREKYNNGKKGTAVIAACGIFVADILDAVPIDKYFELFKPHAGGEGGYIRISMNFVKDLAELQNPGGSAAATRDAPAAAAAAGAGKGKGKSGFRKFLTVLLTLGLVGAAAGVAVAVLPKKKGAAPAASSKASGKDSKAAAQPASNKRPW